MLRAVGIIPFSETGTRNTPVDLWAISSHPFEIKYIYNILNAKDVPFDRDKLYD